MHRLGGRHAGRPRPGSRPTAHPASPLVSLPVGHRQPAPGRGRRPRRAGGGPAHRGPGGRPRAHPGPVAGHLDGRGPGGDPWRPTAWCSPCRRRRRRAPGRSVTRGGRPGRHRLRLGGRGDPGPPARGGTPATSRAPGSSSPRTATVRGTRAPHDRGHLPVRQVAPPGPARRRAGAGVGGPHRRPPASGAGRRRAGGRGGGGAGGRRAPPGRPPGRRVTRWDDAFPQYRVHHLLRVAGIEAELVALPGLAVAGVVSGRGHPGLRGQRSGGRGQGPGRHGRDDGRRRHRPHGDGPPPPRPHRRPRRARRGNPPIRGSARPGRAPRGGVALPSLAAGLALALSLPPWGWWILAFAGAGLLWWRLAGLSPGAAVGRVAGGLGCFVRACSGPTPSPSPGRRS